MIRLNAAEQKELNSRMEKKQMKEFMTVCFCYGIIEFNAVRLPLLVIRDLMQLLQ